MNVNKYLQKPNFWKVLLLVLVGLWVFIPTVQIVFLIVLASFGINYSSDKISLHFKEKQGELK